MVTTIYSKEDAAPEFLQEFILWLLTYEEIWFSWSAQEPKRPKQSQAQASKNVAAGLCKTTARGCKITEQNCYRKHFYVKCILCKNLL